MENQQNSKVQFSQEYDLKKSCAFNKRKSSQMSHEDYVMRQDSQFSFNDNDFFCHQQILSSQTKIIKPKQKIDEILNNNKIRKIQIQQQLQNKKIYLTNQRNKRFEKVNKLLKLKSLPSQRLKPESHNLKQQFLFKQRNSDINKHLQIQKNIQLKINKGRVKNNILKQYIVKLHKKNKLRTDKVKSNLRYIHQKEQKTIDDIHLKQWNCFQKKLKQKISKRYKQSLKDQSKQTNIQCKIVDFNKNNSHNHNHSHSHNNISKNRKCNTLIPKQIKQTKSNKLTNIIIQKVCQKRKKTTECQTNQTTHQYSINNVITHPIINNSITKVYDLGYFGLNHNLSQHSINLRRQKQIYNSILDNIKNYLIVQKDKMGQNNNIFEQNKTTEQQIMEDEIDLIEFQHFLAKISNKQIDSYNLQVINL